MQVRYAYRRRFFVPQNDNFFYVPFVILNGVKNLLKATIRHAGPLCISKKILRSSE